MDTTKRPIIANINRLNQFMDEAGLSAIVIRSGKNFTYLAGFAYPGTLARHLEFPDSPRAVLLLWPRTGEPVMILNHTAAPLAARDSWLSRIELVEGYSESPYARAAELIGRLGLEDSRIGFEKSYISAQSWEELGGLLPRAELVDCSRMMDRVRWIKTPGELALLKEGADILDSAYLEVFPEVKPGDTERDVHARLVASCIARGAGWAHGILNSSRNTVAYGGEGDMRFELGDIIRNDYVSYFLGYPGHQSRSVVVGAPSEDQKKTYTMMRDIYRATVDQCRAGARAIDIYAFASQKFQDCGYRDPLALVGHGVGAWWHQQAPYIVNGSEEVLEAGMVIAMEPHVSHWHLQDMFLITDDGPELLSTRFNTDEMLVAG